MNRSRVSPNTPLVKTRRSMNPIHSPRPASGPRWQFLPLLFLLTAPLALAHPGHGQAVGLAAGFEHPLSGWDHLIAMIAIGLWAAQLGGRALWAVPAAFVGTMAGAAAFGHCFGAIPGTEQGIAASVLVIGLLLAGAVRLPTPAAAALVGVFAVFHGIAHGAEMPATAAGASYGLGFLAATALLHAAGVGAGVAAARISTRMPRYAGWGIVAACALALTAR
jgi:urease accessory protein